MSMRIHPTRGSVSGVEDSGMELEAFDAADDIFDEYKDLQPPAPPRNIYVMAKADHAILWWDTQNIYSDKITHFVVKRYRLDEMTKKWLIKGTCIIKNIEAKYHYIRNLQPLKTYRFSVSGVNKADKGMESKKSAAVLIEPELPNGWFRLHDNASNRDFYYCPRSAKSSWSRPDNNPYFVDYSIARHFTDREIMSLIDVYAEEMRNFEVVSKHRFKDCIEELGRPCSDMRYLHKAITELVEGHTPESQAHIDAEQTVGRKLEKDCLRTFQGFMIMVQYTKYRALKVKQNPLYVLAELGSLRMKRNEDDLGFREADWVLKKCSFLNRTTFRGVLTKQKSFFTPHDYLVYLKPEKRQYFSAAFDPEEIATIEKIYLYLDSSMTGQVSVEEFCRFMSCLSLVYSTRNNNRNDKSPLSRAMSRASSKKMLDASNPDVDMDKTFIQLFQVIDKSNKGYLKFEDFVLLFVSLPTREVDARKSYLLRSDSLSSMSHVSTKSLALSEKGGNINGKYSEKRGSSNGRSPILTSTLTNDAGDGDPDAVSVLSMSSAFNNTKYGKMGSILSKFHEGIDLDNEEYASEEGSLQGNEFRIVNVASVLPELGFFRANSGDLAMIFDELLISNKEITVWETNKLAVGDLLITKSPPWFKMAFNSTRSVVKKGISAVKGFFKRQQSVNIEKEEYLDSDNESDSNDVHTFDDDQSNDTQSRNKKVKKQVQFDDVADGMEEDGGVFSIFGGNKCDTTATHGPICFCGCGNPYWVEEETAALS